MGLLDNDEKAVRAVELFSTEDKIGSKAFVGSIRNTSEFSN